MDDPTIMQTTVMYRGYQINLDGPICLLPARDILWPLCANLSVDDSLGGDWRNLADVIGLPAQMIHIIDAYRGDRTKAHTLMQLWDDGIPKNPGSVRKLIAALHFAGFEESFLKDYLLSPLQDSIDLNALQNYLATLSKSSMFPRLNLSDVCWDHKIEDQSPWVPHAQSNNVTIESPSKEEPDDGPCYLPQIVEDSVYISHITDSRSDKYRREVKNMVGFFRKYQHVVWYDDGERKYDRQMLHDEKERWIRSAANIIVVFNKEYQKAYDSYIYGGRLPSCVAVDIPLIQHIFHNTTGGQQRIIPVVIDRCRTQPSASDFPVCLTGMPRHLFPSESNFLLHCVQKIPTHKLSKSRGIKQVQQIRVDRDEVRRKFLAKKK